MYYVGIDIAKRGRFASVISAEGEVLVKPFKFTNDNDGFCRLLSVLASYDRSSLIIGLESTAHYADNLVEFLVSRRYQVCSSTRSRLPRCVRTTSGRPRPTRLIR